VDIFLGQDGEYNLCSIIEHRTYERNLMLYKVLSIFLFGFALYLLAVVLVETHIPAHRYPEWTPQQRKELKRVLDKRTTVVRIGMNQYYTIKRGKEVAR
jgi:hypothetical protein